MTELWESYWREKPAGTKGDTGASGTSANHGPWVVSHAYAAGDKVTHARSGHGLSMYDCILMHTSTANDEPETGVNRATYWLLGPEGGNDGAGAGDVVGPASSVTGNLAVFQDTGGKEIEDSLIAQSAINFNGLAESTSALDPDGDFVKIYQIATGLYKKVHTQLFGRKTESIILTAQGIWPTYTNGCLPSTNLQLPTAWWRYVSAIPFADGAISYAECDFVLPWYYDGGPITARFHWFVPTTGAGTVIWTIAGQTYGDGDCMDTAVNGNPQEILDTTHVTAYDILISDPTPAITLGGTPAGAKGVILLIGRDPVRDSLAATACLKGIEIRYGCLE